MEGSRFVNDDFLDSEEFHENPIEGYGHSPLLTLEEAVQMIISSIPDIMKNVDIAKTKCDRSSPLTWDESAAIYLYTMGHPLSTTLNNALRTKNRCVLESWFAFLKLLITALEKLEPIKKTVWRGVSDNYGSIYADGDAHIWWSINSCSMNPQVIVPYLGETGTIFAIDTIDGKDISTFSAFPEEKEVVLLPGTRVRARSQAVNFLGPFHLVSLDEENDKNKSQFEPAQLFEEIRQKYRDNAFIERIINPAKCIPMEQSYIKLAIGERQEQHEKEKKLGKTLFNEAILNTFEQLYDVKSVIDVENIFEKCEAYRKQVLIFGRAGTGKTTFCRYVTYRWATGAIWQDYDLVVLIRLRNLIESRYPQLPYGVNYSLFDLVKKECFHRELSGKEEIFLKEQLYRGRILWLLDGYDEVIQNVSTHLEYTLKHLLNTRHHILTSRPYLNTLSYHVQLEITGFTDDSIEDYVKQFFDQIQHEINNASSEAENLLNFLKSNVRIWAIAHIPVNLELICSRWCDNDWSKTPSMTIIYENMVEWLCRRYLEKQNNECRMMRDKAVYKHCAKELMFLQTLAFYGISQNIIILGPDLLNKVETDTGYFLDDHPQLLNIGILKSFDHHPIGTNIEANKSHYFIHLSFQEYFAARYLIEALHGNANQKKKAIDFIRTNKYNHRFELVFTFASGLLSHNHTQQGAIIFWKTLIEEPVDLIGFRRAKLIILCLAEAEENSRLPSYNECIELIIKWIDHSVWEKYEYSYNYLLWSIKKSQLLGNHREILDTFVNYYEAKNLHSEQNLFKLVLKLPSSKLGVDMIRLHLVALKSHCAKTREKACEALGKMGQQAATSEVIQELSHAFDDIDDGVQSSARKALLKIDEKTAIPRIINGLLTKLNDEKSHIRGSACRSLAKLGEKAVTHEVISRLKDALEDEDNYVRQSAHQALDRLQGKTATTDWIQRRRSTLELEHKNGAIRSYKDEVLDQVNKQEADGDLITRLTRALRSPDDNIREQACKALGNMGKNAATPEVINELVNTLSDTNDFVISSVCEAFVELFEQGATEQVISGLVSGLKHKDDNVRQNICDVLGNIGKQAATNEVILGLVNALSDSSPTIRPCACEALIKMDEKAATNPVIHALLDMKCYDDFYLEYIAHEAIENILSVFPNMSNLHENIVLKLSNYIDQAKYSFGNSISPEKIIQAFLETKKVCWLPIIKNMFTRHGYGLTVEQNSIVIYGNKEPVMFEFTDKQLGQRVRSYLENSSDRSIMYYCCYCCCCC